MDRILIVLMGSIGDVARALPIPRALKNEFPNATISWLVEPKSADLVRLCAHVDETIIFQRSHPVAGFSDLWRTWRDRRSCGANFDLVLDLQRHAKSGLFSFLAGGKRSLGVHRLNAKEGNWLFHKNRVEYIPADVPKNKMYEAFLIALGIEEGMREPAVVREALLRDDLAELTPKHTAGIVLGSSWKSKDWVAEGYAKLLTEIDGEFETFALLGTGQMEGLATELQQLSLRSEVVPLCGKTSLAELTGVIAGLKVCVGPDSGPAHIAAALGVPTVTLFGPTDPQRTAPVGPQARVVEARLGCRPCYRRSCPGLGRLCMRLLSIPEIARKIREVVASTPC